MHVIVAGGGKVGYYLARTLLERKHQVTIVEQKEARCAVLAQQLLATVIRGDATDPAILADAGADEADTLAAVTGKDEQNFVICQMAKRKFSLRRVIARASNPRNHAIMQQLGVDDVISSTSVIADLIERELAQEAIQTLLTFQHGEMTLLEVDLPPGAPAVRRRVRDLARELPEDSVFVTLIRGGRIIFPRGDTQLQAHDAVLAVTTHASEPALRAVLLGE